MKSLLLLIVPLEMKGMACHAGPHGGITRIVQKEETKAREKNRSQLHCFFFMGMTRQGWGHSLQLPSLHNPGGLWSKRDVFTCLVPGAGLIWSRRNIGLVCES